MAETLFTTDDALTVKKWEAKKLYMEPIKQSFFSRFMSSSGDNVVYENNKFEKEQGDRVRFALIPRLGGQWVTEDQDLEGNENDFSRYYYDLTLTEYACAVKDKGPIHRQRALFSIDEVSQTLLKNEIKEKIDQLMFDAVDTSPTKIFYKTSTGSTSTDTASTAKTALTADYGKISGAMISYMKTWALTGGHRTQPPFGTVSDPKTNRPVYFLLCHPDALFDWKQTSEYTQAAREAEVRGKDNPIFTGITGLWDSVALFENEKCPVATDGGSGAVAWTRAYLLGASAISWAWAKRPALTSESFDYKRKHGYGVSMVCKAGKTQFNSLDWAAASIYLARTNVS